MGWQRLRQDVLEEFAEADRRGRRRFDLGGLTIVRHEYLRPSLDVVDLDAYERELALAAMARRNRERREAAEAVLEAERRRQRHTRLDADAYAAKLVRDATGRRARRAERARTLVRLCKHCGAPLTLTPRTVHKRFCAELCKHRWYGELRKTRA